MYLCGIISKGGQLDFRLCHRVKFRHLGPTSQNTREVKHDETYRSAIDHPPFYRDCQHWTRRGNKKSNLSLGRVILFCWHFILCKVSPWRKKHWILRTNCWICQDSHCGDIKVSSINLLCNVVSVAFNRPSSNAYVFLMPVVLRTDDQ